MNPKVFAPKSIHCLFLSRTAPTDLQSAQLAEYFGANPKAMIHTLHEYAGHVGKVHGFHFIGRLAHVAGERQVFYGVVLLPTDLFLPWQPPSRLIEVEALIAASQKDAPLPPHSEALMDVATMVQQVKEAVRRRASLHPLATRASQRPPVLSMELFHGNLAEQAEYIHVCSAIIVRLAYTA